MMQLGLVWCMVLSDLDWLKAIDSRLLLAVTYRKKDIRVDFVSCQTLIG